MLLKGVTIPRSITLEFKREYAKLVAIHDHYPKQDAEVMGVGLSSVQRWVSPYKKERQDYTSSRCFDYRATAHLKVTETS